MDIQEMIFEIKGDEQGSLVPMESLRNIPFDIKRIYYITNTKQGVVRGHHAHRELKQVLVCVHGSCKISLDDGTEKKEVVLDQYNKGIYLDSVLWRTMYDFSPDAVLLVLASTLYDDSDYIRDYDEFLSYIKTINGED